MVLHRVWVAAAVGLMLGAYGVSAGAVTPLAQKVLGVAGSKQGKPAAAQEASIAERRAEIETQLAAARDAVDREKAGQYPVPAGATPSQVAELDWLLARIPHVLQAQLDLLQELEAARANRAAATEALEAWKGPDQPGPYTLTQLDRALDQLEAERTRLNSLKSVAELQREELQRIEAQLKSSQSDERLALEKATQGVAAPLELARLRSRRISEVLLLMRLQGELNDELMATSKARAELLQKQAAAVSADYRFSAPELERVLKGLQAQQAGYDKRVDDAHDARNRAVQERDNARRVLEAMPAAKSVEEVRRLADQQARLDAANTTLDALRAELSALTTMRGLLPLAMEAWRLRYTALSDSDPDARQKAEKSLTALLSRVDALKSYATDLSTLTVAALRNQQARVSSLDENAPGRRHEQAALDAAARAAAAVGDVEATAQRLVIAQTRWKREYAEASKHRSASERAAEVWAGTKDVAGSVWNFELFAVEDTVDIGGKPVTLARGVTVGKSVGALLIFVIGYQLVAFLATRAQRVMVERFEMDPAQARVLRRWIMLLTGFVLLVITLNLARIPLTVFAFMGGALAIGIGFGTQTLLRNFISGIIVLFERKVRVGDIVDVDGVQGVVTAVDVRSTTVRQFDGIETMVPNSLLLENKVTNWTGESPTMRRVVKVGVAYGSPTRHVAEIMKATADEHGLVLKDPAPYVIFEDFGDNALIFALYFWVDLAKSNGMQVQSDLRFMLEKRFADAGVSIAYPQRDVHLDATRPLQIEVVGDRALPGQPS